MSSAFEGEPRIGSFDEELGVFVIDHTTRLVLQHPIESGWRLETTADVMELPDHVSEPAVIAA